MPFTVVYDACVLYPSITRDLLIRVANEGMVQARLSEQIPRETFRNLKTNRPGPLRKFPEMRYCGHEVVTMAQVKNVGVREFRDHATAYLSGREPVAVSKHGRVIGFYIPLKRDDAEVQRAVVRLSAAVDDVVATSGLTEDELAELLDLRHSAS